MFSPASAVSPPSVADELDALSHGVVVVNERWEIIRWNRAIAEIFGTPPNVALGSILWECIPALRQAEPEKRIRHVMRHRRRSSEASVQLVADGGYVLRAVQPLGASDLLLEVESSGQTSALEEMAALYARADHSGRETRALAEIVQGMNQSLDVERVFQLITRHAAELLGGSSARLGVLDGEDFVLAASWGPTGDDIGFRVPVIASVCRECVETRRAIRVDDVSRETERWAWSAAHVPAGRPNAVAAPLVIAERVLGTITVYGNDARDFDSHDEELLTALAGHAALAIENARLFQAATRTTLNARILATSARTLAQNVTPRAMYADIGRVGLTALGAQGVSIFLADAVTGHVELALLEGVGAAQVGSAMERFWETTGGRVVRDGAPVFWADLRTDADEPVARSLSAQGVRAAALLPLVIEGNSRGMLALRFLETQPFDADQRQLLTDFATHASVAVRNAQLFADVELRAARLAAVAQVQRAMSAAISLDEVYGRIYLAVASVVDSPCFVLLSFDEEAGAFVPEYTVNDGVPIPCDTLPRFPVGSGSTSQALLSGEPNVAARSSRGWSGTVHEVESAAQIAVVLSAPIIHGDRVLGVLQAQSYQHDAYDWSDVDLIMLIARQAGTAIVNARAFDAERRERAQAEAAAAIARIALRAFTVDDAAAAVLGVITEVVPSRGAVLSVVCAETGTMRRAATFGDEASLSGEIVLPLSASDRVIGALSVQPNDYTTSERDRSVLERLADPVALALNTLLLREEERRQQVRQHTLATALEAMEQPVFIVSPEFTIQYANGAAIREYRYAPDEMLGMQLERLRVHPIAPTEMDAICDALRSSVGWTAECLHRRKDGDEFPVWAIVTAIRDSEGHSIGQVMTIRNLTEERRVSEQLRQSERLAALGELVAGVAHEVNNPLTGISAFAQLLLEEDLSSEQRESVTLMKREADRAVAVIRDLLTFARKTGPRYVVVDIKELADQTLRLRTYSLRTTGIDVELALGDEPVLVEGDDRQLQQVLLNLFMNAEHAMLASPVRKLTIRARNESGRVVIEVADSGTGMTAEVQKRIFEPFFTTKPEGSGTGLGLSVSYGIVQAHGGTLTVHSTPGLGSTFRLSFPAASARAIARGAPAPGRSSGPVLSTSSES